MSQHRPTPPTRGTASARRAPGDGNWFRRRHTAKKRRLAAMTRRRRIWRRVGVSSTWLLALFAVVLVTLTLAFYQLTRVPKPADLAINQIAMITYSDGTPMAKIGDTDRTIVSLSKVPVPVRDAVLAAEDRGFYSESGVSVRGTLRAAANDLTGGDTQGGSGITQQYVKNAYLNDSRTLSRKLKELAIAIKLDREYSKNQILEWYLNTIYFGRGAYGIEAAAQAYFKLDVSQLNVSQGAMLAGLIQAPSDYDPATALTLATQRWNYVLDGLVSMKKLSVATRAEPDLPEDGRPVDRSARRHRADRAHRAAGEGRTDRGRHQCRHPQHRRPDHPDHDQPQRPERGAERDRSGLRRPHSPAGEGQTPGSPRRGRPDQRRRARLLRGVGRHRGGLRPGLAPARVVLQAVHAGRGAQCEPGRQETGLCHQLDRRRFAAGHRAGRAAADLQRSG